MNIYRVILRIYDECFRMVVPFNDTFELFFADLSRSFIHTIVDFMACRLRLIKMHRGISCLGGRKGINKSCTRTESGICIMGIRSFIRKTRCFRCRD